MEQKRTRAPPARGADHAAVAAAESGRATSAAARITYRMPAQQRPATLRDAAAEAASAACLPCRPRLSGAAVGAASVQHTHLPATLICGRLSTGHHGRQAGQVAGGVMPRPRRFFCRRTGAPLPDAPPAGPALGRLLAHSRVPGGRDALALGRDFSVGAPRGPCVPGRAVSARAVKGCVPGWERAVLGRREPCPRRSWDRSCSQRGAGCSRCSISPSRGQRSRVRGREYRRGARCTGGEVCVTTVDSGLRADST